MTSSVAVLLVLVATASALPQFFAPQPARNPGPLQRTHLQDDSGQFSSSVQGYDGQLHQETGVLKPTPDGKDYVLVYTGNYRYISPEGTPVEIHYTADENGFRPTGNAIPVQGAAIAPAF